MAGSDKPRWESVAKSKFQDALKHPDFVKDLETVKELFEVHYHELTPMILGLIKKYDLPRGTHIFIRDYICFEGEEWQSDITSPIFLVSEADNYVGPKPTVTLEQYETVAPTNRVSLELTGEIQKQDLLDFINLNWKLIETKLKLAEPLRPGAVRGKLADNLHVRVLELREKEAKSYREIAAITGLTEANIAKVLHRMRKHRKMDNNK